MAFREEAAKVLGQHSIATCWLDGMAFYLRCLVVEKQDSLKSQEQYWLATVFQEQKRGENKQERVEGSLQQ